MPTGCGGAGRRGEVLHDGQLDRLQRHQRDQPARRVADGLRGGVVGVGLHQRHAGVGCSRSAIVSGTLAISGTSSSSASAWPPPSPKIG